MIYTFLTEKDLDVGMKKYFREQITELQAKIHIQETSESAAFSLIKSKLNDRYNLALLFPTIKEWSDESDYLEGEYAYKNDTIYKAKQDSTDQDPETNESDYWEKNDPRDQLLVVYCAILTVYFMLRSVAPHKITETLDNDYAGILEWLSDVKDGCESPDWPLKEDGSTSIQWGSNERNEHYY